MALKGLDANSVAARHNAQNPELNAFIGGAAVQGKAPAKKAGRKPNDVKPTKTTFSLTDTVNKDIDRLSLAPRSFKATRSDIVRAGVAVLKAMPEHELVELLARIVGVDTESDSS
jgi:hypothetical protein